RSSDLADPRPARSDGDIATPALSARKRGATGQRQGRQDGSRHERAHSEFLVEAHRDPARKDLDEQRYLSVRRPVSKPRAEEPAGDDVGLPVRLTLHPGVTVIDRQELERPDPGVLAVIVEN